MDSSQRIRLSSIHRSRSPPEPRFESMPQKREVRNQSKPLLSLIASTFGLSATNAGIIAMLSQLGTALGILCFVPLGDTKERRSLIVRLLFVACVCLLAMATARGLWWLVVASFGIGLTAATVHVIVPYAANLAPEARRGRVIGTVMSGLLLGILLARTISGLLAA
jgi:predicted MFS family arabinose efflux permease